MPRGDRTGPQGAGPMTGRRAGYCAGYDVPGYMNNVPGSGYGYGFGNRGAGRGGQPWGGGRGRAWGGGRGPGYGYYGAAYPDYYQGYGAALPMAPMTKDQEIEGLKAQADSLKSAMSEINKRIDELKASTEKK